MPPNDYEPDLESVLRQYWRQVNGIKRQIACFKEVRAAFALRVVQKDEPLPAKGAGSLIEMFDRHQREIEDALALLGSPHDVVLKFWAPKPAEYYPEELLERSFVDYAEMTHQTYRCLKEAGITKIRVLAQMSPEQLLAIDGLEAAQLTEIRMILLQMGLTLGMQIPESENSNCSIAVAVSH